LVARSSPEAQADPIVPSAISWRGGLEQAQILLFIHADPSVCARFLKICWDTMSSSGTGSDIPWFPAPCAGLLVIL